MQVLEMTRQDILAFSGQLMILYTTAFCMLLQAHTSSFASTDMGTHGGVSVTHLCLQVVGTHAVVTYFDHVHHF